jgi:hypothetical protein
MATQTKLDADKVEKELTLQERRPTLGGQLGNIHRPATILPIIQKPEYGEPCNGCGFCCKEEICAIGKEVLKTEAAPCPVLELRDGIYRCGLLALAANAEHACFLIWRLGIGMGCDSDAELPR